MIAVFTVPPANGLTGSTLYHVVVLKGFATQPLDHRWSFEGVLYDLRLLKIAIIFKHPESRIAYLVTYV